MTHQDSPWYLKGFRKAKVASPWWNLTKTLIHTTLFWSVFLFLIPWAMSTLEGQWGWNPPTFPGHRAVAIAGFVVAGSLGLWSGATMAIIGGGTPLPLDHPNRLVVRGPYRYVRNPMAIAGLSQGLFAGIFYGSWLAIPYVVIGGVLWNALARPPEERQLERDFGEPYARYKAAVGCWIPLLRPYRSAPQES
jgi:protein-S-isoprenylcysteine O-methyltransferase Ste14